MADDFGVLEAAGISRTDLQAVAHRRVTARSVRLLDVRCGVRKSAGGPLLLYDLDALAAALCRRMGEINDKLQALLPPAKLYVVDARREVAQLGASHAAAEEASRAGCDTATYFWQDMVLVCRTAKGANVLREVAGLTPWAPHEAEPEGNAAPSESVVGRSPWVLWNVPVLAEASAGTAPLLRVKLAELRVMAAHPPEAAVQAELGALAAHLRNVLDAQQGDAASTKALLERWCAEWGATLAPAGGVEETAAAPRQPIEAPLPAWLAAPHELAPDQLNAELQQHLTADEAAGGARWRMVLEDHLAPGLRSAAEGLLPAAAAAALQQLARDVEAAAPLLQRCVAAVDVIMSAAHRQVASGAASEAAWREWHNQAQGKVIAASAALSSLAYMVDRAEVRLEALPAGGPHRAAQSAVAAVRRPVDKAAAAMRRVQMELPEARRRGQKAMKAQVTTLPGGVAGSGGGDAGGGGCDPAVELEAAANMAVAVGKRLQKAVPAAGEDLTKAEVATLTAAVLAAAGKRDVAAARAALAAYQRRVWWAVPDAVPYPVPGTYVWQYGEVCLTRWSLSMLYLTTLRTHTARLIRFASLLGFKGTVRAALRQMLAQAGVVKQLVAAGFPAAVEVDDMSVLLLDESLMPGAQVQLVGGLNQSGKTPRLLEEGRVPLQRMLLTAGDAVALLQMEWSRLQPER